MHADKLGQDADIEIVSFDSIGAKILRKAKGKNITYLTLDEFQPRALTPLYDAVGAALIEPPGIVAKKTLFIFTDGQENASVSHDASSIRQFIKQRQKEGWVILYLGANVDAWKEASEMGIP